MNFFKRLFRKPAILFVTLWANRAYREGVKAADERSRREGKIIYLAAKTFHPDVLATYSKEQFKRQKNVIGYHARLLTMNTLKHGCYYHTPDKFGNNGMSDRDREIRRKAFIRERLRSAKLI